MTKKIALLWQSSKAPRGLGYTLLIILGFALLSALYFAPSYEGKEIYQPDVHGTSGNASDVRRYQAETDSTSYWTNSLFGGMPMYQISPSYPSIKGYSRLSELLTLQWPFKLLPSYAWLLFAMMLGFFFFLRALDLPKALAAIGAIGWAFSSYFVILITAGHIWKLTALCFMAPTIAGVIEIYKGRYLWGGVLTTLAATLQIMSNHIQMSYYFAFLAAFIVLALLVDLFRKGEVKKAVRATLTLLGSALLAISINSSNLYHTWEYGGETMRGGSHLTPLEGAPKASQGGLDRDYITQWSYGKMETLTLLIPNLYGGASSPLGEEAGEALEASSLPPQLKGVVGQQSAYWGEQPFTAGPVYVGAFLLFLALLGAFTVKGSLKWALVGGTILSILLSWGRHFMGLTDFFIDYVPLYSKFRTVSSILVVAEFTLPALAMLALRDFIRSPKDYFRVHKAALAMASALTLEVALVLYLFPTSFFGFLSPMEADFYKAHLGDPAYQQLFSGLKDLRIGLLRADALRSILIILVGLLLAYSYKRKWLGLNLFLGLLAGLTLLDLWVVDKRYLGEKDFVSSERIAQLVGRETEADRLILADQDPHYRVLNLAVNTYNDASSSAYHRSVGGYHAAKLQRYQDLIERALSQGYKPALDMLDVRYVILRDSTGGLRVQQNSEAYGAVWLPQELRYAETADEEMALLTSGIDLKHTAILPQEERSSVPEGLTASPEDTIQLLSYKPNEIVYKVDLKGERLAVFSEVYYPHGWRLEIIGSGEVLPILRADYLLRAATLPSGSYQLRMSFKPQSIRLTEGISTAASMALLLIVLYGIMQYLRRREESTLEKES